MSVRTSENPAPSHVFEIRGGSVNVPALRLFCSDIPAIIALLQERIQQAPEFFRDAPVVIDLHALPVDGEPLDLAELALALHQNGLVPVGIRSGEPGYQLAAKQAHLAVFSEVRHEPSPRPAEAKTPPAKLPEPKPEPRPAAVPTRIIQQPVRSGQRIYATGDLIVLAPVSAGAEIMADGNIHVYGSLRGRALAGVQGNAASRIFCMDLQAELVSVAGHYKVSESLDPSVRSKPVQVYLSNDALIVEDL
ncbi:MAG: septum site-determining protein MinC [Methylococcaceae bacterium]|nr:septum site-determining protein MinC [Methylococcaceae bacterium]